MASVVRKARNVSTARRRHGALLAPLGLLLCLLGAPAQATELYAGKQILQRAYATPKEVVQRAAEFNGSGVQ